MDRWVGRIEYPLVRVRRLLLQPYDLSNSAQDTATCPLTLLGRRQLLNGEVEHCLLYYEERQLGHK